MPTAGSWGCAPLVGTSHSLMLTFSSPTPLPVSLVAPACVPAVFPSVVRARSIVLSLFPAAVRGDTIAAPSTTAPAARATANRSEEHTSELQSQSNLVCRLLLEKKKKTTSTPHISNYILTIEYSPLWSPPSNYPSQLHMIDAEPYSSELYSHQDDGLVAVSSSLY